jgi:transcriptional regulator with XRE-family HTH domain
MVPFFKGDDYMPTIDLELTGLNIKRLLKENDLRVTDVQKVLGLSTTNAIYKWLRGETLPTVDNLLILSKLLNTTIDDILIY